MHTCIHTLLINDMVTRCTASRNVLPGMCGSGYQVTANIVNLTSALLVHAFNSDHIIN